MSSCAVDDTKVQQDDGTMRGVEIAPEGCHPVSTDECSSGYMAPSENVTFPEDSMKQCCKCKEGEKCNLCADPDACTEEEVEKFISTDETCYGEPPPEEEEGEEKEEESEGTADTSVNFTVYALLGLLILMLLMFFLFSRRAKTI